MLIEQKEKGVRRMQMNGVADVGKRSFQDDMHVAARKALDVGPAAGVYGVPAPLSLLS
jgi:hypothetical protein